MDPKIVGAFGVLSMCCICSSIVSGVMMGGETKPVETDPANKAQATADEAQTAADAVAADPNSTPEEVATAKAAADKAAKDLADAAAAEAERVRLANMTFREKVVDGQYPTFAGCWAAAGPGTGSGADKFACCESVGTPYPEYGETGWAYCNDNT
tara:strand:+ start:61 stop:525 length:465 start_codon:yes stop_codon:yes gene_type:complete